MVDPERDDNIVPFPRKVSIEDEIKQVNSPKGAIDWVDKYYAEIVDDGVYMILNFRVPRKLQKMTRKHFVESLVALRLTITAEGSTTKPQEMSFAELWLKYLDKRRYDQFVFDPSYEFDPNVTRRGDFNLWPGFAYKPKKGNCWYFLRFVRDIICAGNKKHYRWLLAWLAQIVQHPEFKPGTAIVLIAKKGAGKSFFGKKLRKLFGPDICFKTAKRDDLFGKWNDHLEHSIFSQLEEAIFAGNHQEMSELNELITGDTLSIQTRFKSTKQSLSFMRFLLNANPGDGTKNWVIPATFDERRYSAFYVSEAQMNRKVEYFDPIDEQLENGGYEALMYFLKHFPVHKYNLARGLDTAALRDQKARTAMADKSVKGWWIRYSQLGELPYVDVVDANDRSVAPRFLEDKSGNHVFEGTGRIIDDETELVGEYYYVGKRKLRQEYAKSIGRKLEEIDEVAFGLEFNSLIPALDENGNIVMINEGRRIKTALRDGKTRKTGKTPRMNICKIPKLSVVRDLLDRVVNYRLDWNSEIKHWEQKEFD
jgi:hypothetical protein